MALLDDIESFLIAQGVGVAATGLPSPDWQIFKSFLPDAPDKALAIFETAGQPVDNVSDAPLIRLTFQVRVRGDALGYEAARTKWQEMFDALHDATVSGYVYIFALNSGPLSVGNDGNNRPGLVLNFVTLKE